MNDFHMNTSFLQLRPKQVHVDELNFVLGIFRDSHMQQISAMVVV